MTQSDNPKLVYLLAASHSGSTLTAMLLGSHPDLCTVGELKGVRLTDPDRYLCSCMKNIRQCEFWSTIARLMNKKGFDFDVTNSNMNINSFTNTFESRLLRPLYRGRTFEIIRDTLLYLSPRWPEKLQLFHERNLALLKSIKEVNNVKAIVDSSKTGIRLKYLLKNPNLDVRVIWLVRDGRGVALTHRNPEQYADAKDGSLRGGGSGLGSDRPISMESAVNLWKCSNEEARSIVRQLADDKWIKVKYEELCGDTNNTLKKIYNFIEVESSSINLDYRSVEQHVVGNGMRLDSTSDIELDERWRSELSQADLDIFQNIAGKLNSDLGYS